MRNYIMSLPKCILSAVCDYNLSKIQMSLPWLPKQSNFLSQTPDWQVFHPQSGDFVQFLAKKLDLFVI